VAPSVNYRAVEKKVERLGGRRSPPGPSKPSWLYSSTPSASFWWRSSHYTLIRKIAAFESAPVELRCLGEQPWKPPESKQLGRPGLAAPGVVCHRTLTEGARGRIS